MTPDQLAEIRKLAQIVDFSERYTATGNTKPGSLATVQLARRTLDLLDEVERLRTELERVRDAASRRVNAYRASSDQTVADVRRIRLNLTAANLCDGCRLAATVAFNDLGALLPVETGGTP